MYLSCWRYGTYDFDIVCHNCIFKMFDIYRIVCKTHFRIRNHILKRLMFNMLNKLIIQLQNASFKSPKVSLCELSTYLELLIWVFLLCFVFSFVGVVEYQFDICSEIVSCWEHRVFFTFHATLLAYILQHTVQRMHVR